MGLAIADVQKTDSAADVPSRCAVAILGTSPLLLIEGLLRARAGESVVFFEANAALGGAWRHVDFAGLQDVEGACHLLENYRGAGEFLETVVGVSMEPCVPAPLVRTPRGRLEPYNSRWRTVRRLLDVTAKIGIVAGVRAVEALAGNRWRLPRTRRFRIGLAWRKFDSLRRQPLCASRAQRAIRYPIGGAPALLRQLEAELCGHGARFVTAEVVGLAVGGEGSPVTLELDSGQRVAADAAVLSESTALRSLTLPDGEHTFEVDRRACRHLVVAVGPSAARLCSYVHLHGDPLVVRVADVTDYARGAKPADQRILVLEVTAAGEARGPATLLAYLADLGILPPDLGVEGVEAKELVVTRSGSGLRHRLGRLGEAPVHVVASVGDLALAVLKNRRRWLEFHARARTRLMH